MRVYLAGDDIGLGLGSGLGFGLGSGLGSGHSVHAIGFLHSLVTFWAESFPHLIPGDFDGIATSTGKSIYSLHHQ